jgi:hypothetical protein
MMLRATTIDEIIMKVKSSKDPDGASFTIYHIASRTAADHSNILTTQEHYRKISQVDKLTP